ncbi:MAG: DUF3194 domain-containing protein [Candidatus Thorarchaeota archaeon]|nr:DUF3194 domain-containing protein [Candidatus Thorarchaeota archaeon]
MNPVFEIGLPELSESDLEQLTEECEAAITQHIFDKIPKKSISELTVTCILDLNETLQFEVQLDLVQEYAIGHSLDDILEGANKFEAEWLEKRLVEMKAH